MITSILLLFSIAFGQTCIPKIERKVIRGDSMKGIFKNNQEVSVDMNYYRCKRPAVGEIVLIQKKNFRAPIIKQILVGPGQSFYLMNQNKGAVMMVNGSELKNSLGSIYLFREKSLKMLKLYEKSFNGKMPADSYFVFGSGLSESRDSTRFGPVSRDEIIAKVLTK